MGTPVPADRIFCSVLQKWPAFMVWGRKILRAFSFIGFYVSHKQKKSFKFLLFRQE